MYDVLLSEEISEISNSVGAISNELLLGLLTIIFVAVDIRQNGRDLTVCNQSQPVWP